MELNALSPAPWLLPDHEENTLEFMKLATNTHNTPFRVLILRQNILKHDTYKRFRDPTDGKLKLALQDGERVLKGLKGRDWSSPAIYDLVTKQDLLAPHCFHYPEIKKQGILLWDEQNNCPAFDPETNEPLETVTKKCIYKKRPPLWTAITNADQNQKLLLIPTLVKPRNLMVTKETDTGIPYTVMDNYSTKDVATGRCVWVDIDGHGLPLEEIKQLNPLAVDRLLEILPAHCAQTGVPVPAVVNSGRGVHLYWWFERYVDLQSNEAGINLPQIRFKTLLNRVSQWAQHLIQSDPLCSRVWETDSSTCAIFHMMNLPGTTHPKTGTRRYVANKYGVDYQLCDYEALCDTFHVDDLVTPAKSKPESSHQISFFDLPPEVNTVPIPVNDDVVVPPNDNFIEPSYPCAYKYNSRVRKLITWAERKNWDLNPGRHTFLFYLGVAHQTGAAFDLTCPSNYLLHEINQRLLEPLSREEVDAILSSLAKKTYRPRNTTIANKLNMTPEETNWFCTSNAEKANNSYHYVDFKTKLKEIRTQTARNLDHETTVEYNNRIYHMTCQWFDENRINSSRNGARTRKRKEHPDYTGKPGRHSTYSEDVCTLCLNLKTQGLSIRKIAQQLGILRTTVSDLLKRTAPKCPEIGRL